MIQRYKDIIFNRFSKAGNNINRIIRFKPIMSYLDSFTRSIIFKPVINISQHLRTIRFQPLVDVVTNVRTINFIPSLGLDFRTIIFEPLLDITTKTIKFIPILSISSFTVKFLILEAETTTYDVRFEIYNVEDCDEEFITLNC